jgi:hypothetical protein
MKVYNPIDIIDDCIVNASFIINSPDSGFSFYLGYREDEFFATGVGFYGYSGYIFDHSGTFFGGYSSGSQFTLSCHLFDTEQRISYFYNDVLMCNNLPYKNTLTVNSIEFDKINDSTALIFVNDKIENNFYSLQDSDRINLISYDNKLLRTLSI